MSYNFEAEVGGWSWTEVGQRLVGIRTREKKNASRRKRTR